MLVGAGFSEHYAMSRTPKQLRAWADIISRRQIERDIRFAELVRLAQSDKKVFSDHIAKLRNLCE